MNFFQSRTIIFHDARIILINFRLFNLNEISKHKNILTKRRKCKMEGRVILQKHPLFKNLKLP